MGKLEMAESTAGNETGNDDPVIHQARKTADHIRLGPAMYIGAIGAAGLQVLAYELLEYGLGELSSGPGKSLHVRIHTDGSLSVADDGPGIPVEPSGTASMTT